MTDYLVHPTKDGDRWDLLAYRYYGDVSLQGELINANRALFFDAMTIPLILPSGLDIIVPIRERPTAVSTAALPPWKR
ncbi:phage tail protein X [Ancylobacter sp. 3268]|uniref:tail protein X n=1 Tax=Ancylobacter sp. 3268 TaxID=2817752 RepID=UPI00285AA0D3|nr:tail protein X [Ancylobacter sp. 3268]MDR6952684.1 phage tail protein X [Ancylobacter sp. 3268]